MIVLIHIGKCGGGTLSQELAAEGVKFRKVHVEKPDYSMDDQYYIVLRNPIERTVSAFNWRYHLVVITKQKEGLDHDILVKYGCINNLAEQLYDSDGELDIEVSRDFKSIGHIKQDISFYLEDFLKECDPQSIKGIITTKNLRLDLKRYFDIDMSKHAHDNTGRYDTTLSDLACANLKRFLYNEYECIGKLREWDLLDDEVFEDLMK